jgi:hypothetical protein
MKTNETQPLPTEGEGDIMLALEKRVRERREKGVATYGRSLQAFNGRRALVDAVEEAVDLAAYLEQELHERARLEAQLAAERKRADEAERCTECEHLYVRAVCEDHRQEETNQLRQAEATAGALRAALEDIATRGHNEEFCPLGSEEPDEGALCECCECCRNMIDEAKAALAAPPHGKDAGEEQRPWFGWATEYPDEGYTPIEAATEAEAQSQIREILNAADDPDDEPMPTSVRPITAADVDALQETIEDLIGQRNRITEEFKAANDGAFRYHARLTEAEGLLRAFCAAWESGHTRVVVGADAFVRVAVGAALFLKPPVGTP